MRTLSTMSADNELSNLEFGLDLELNSDDVAAVEAAVAAHGESLVCSCCDLELTDKDSLHLHQISQHTASQLSIALLSLRGFDMSSGLDSEVTQDLYHQDSDSESTVSAHSSFMFGFAEELSKTVSQNSVCAKIAPNIPDGSYGCGDTKCASLLNGFQYPCDSPGKFTYGGSNTGMDTFEVDMNRNHPSADNLEIKNGHFEADWRANVSYLSFPTDGGGMSNSSYGDEHRQTALVHDFHEADLVTTTQFNKCPKNRKKNPQQIKERKAPSGGSLVNPTASKKPKLTGDQKQANIEYECREFSCEICGRKYKRKSHLGRHIRMHSGVRPFPCTLCDKRFAVRSILKQHMRVHTGERPFNCVFCFQRFPQKSGLVTHMMLHTGKPYKCDLCEKSFVSNHKLNVHKKAHEEQSGRWPAMGPHACSMCSTRFFTSSALAEHAKVHSVVTGTPSVTPLPVIESNEPENNPYDASIGCKPSNDLNVVTHNYQEVSAGQALLTLMDSNVVADDPAPREECVPKEVQCVSEDSDGSEVPIDFEFCDVPLDLKSSIYLKEECFEMDDNAPQSDQRGNRSSLEASR